MAEPAYLWTPCNEDLYVNTPDGESTEMTWYGREFVAGLLARLDVCVAGEWLESELLLQILEIDGPVIDPHGPLAHASFDFSAPEALLVNSNEVSDAKVGSVRMRFEGTIPSDGTISLRCQSGGDLVRLLGDSSWTVTSNEVALGWTATAYIEGVAASSALGDIRLDAVFECDGEEHVCGSAALTVVGIGGVDFPDEPDGLPVVPPDTSVAVGLEVFPDAARGLLWAYYETRLLQEDGTFTAWSWEGDGEPDTQEGYVWSPEGGVCQVRATAGFWSSECPSGTDMRDCWRDTTRPAYVYVPREPHLVFDYDRDGVIGTNDVAKAKDGSTTFRFWINDDNDSGDTNDSANDIPGCGPNGGDFQVNGRGDLLDFTPVWMDFSDVFPTGTPAQVWNKVEWRIQSSCVNVVWSNLGRSNAGSFQREGDLYEFGPQLYDLAECADVTNVADGVKLPEILRDLMRGNPDKGVFLIEGWSSGFDLTIEGWTAADPSETSEWLVTSEADLCITGVEDMYRFASLRGAAEDPTLTVDVPAFPPNRPDGAKDLDVFFTHGFNVNAGDARAWGSEVFKRLWQSGSNANFHMLPWRGDYRLIDQTDLTTDLSALHYQHNAWFAQRTGGALKRYVEAAQPVAAKRVLMTQSLGNMVACEALREGLQVGQYYMFDAAIPSEAIDETLRAESREDEAFAKYVPSAWHDYTNACWAANWHRFFKENPNDARGKMGWANRFQDALANATEVFNYYSSGDEVFHETANPPSLLAGLDESWANYCWQKQETLKGSRLPAGTAYGGWRFHVWTTTVWNDREQRWDGVITNYTPAAAAAMVADGTVTNNPVFNRGFSPMFDRNAPLDDQWLAVAKYVPAVSSPVGGKIVLGRNRDFDLNSDNYRNGWGRSAVDDKTDWHHSDMKDMAYFYVYKLYEQLIQKGDLK